MEKKRERARIFLRNNIKVFIKDIYENYHFCQIKEINQDWLIVEGFEGNRKGETTRILWVDILVITEYKEDLK